MVGRVEEYLMGKIRGEGAILMSLIDPEKERPESASLVAKHSERGGASAVMVGGSTVVSPEHLDAVIKAIKDAITAPVILFPNNITCVSRYADAIWFMSLLNSFDPYFITGAQVLAAPLVQRFRLEPIPLGYLISGQGGAAAVIGKASPIPYDEPELAAAHALAAQFLGMRFVYLEGGSGVSAPVPSRMVRMVKEAIDVPLIVGGGIRTGDQAREIVGAGADVIVTGTALEESGEGSVRGKIEEIVQGIRAGAIHRSVV